MFSIQLDTSQDVTSQDQCSIILRYVTDKIHERLLCILKCDKSTGEYFATLVANYLQIVGLSMQMCIGNATDGAANMRGAYNGFRALILGENPNQLHIWCYAHILNLVLSDCTNLVIPSFTLFNLLNDLAVFIKDSYQRMNVWNEENEDDCHHKRLGVIGETRWWSKDRALRNIFGEVGNPESGLYIVLMKVLSRIESDAKFNPTCRARAKSYKENMAKYETILTAHIFLRIFDISTPLSKYLQTSNADLLTCSALIETATQKLTQQQSDFDLVVQITNEFITKVSRCLEELDIDIETSLPAKRNVPDALHYYEINYHNKIMSQVVQSMCHRYKENLDVIKDIALLSPVHFEQIQSEGLPVGALDDLSKNLINFDIRATPDALRDELKSFAQNWPSIKMAFANVYERTDMNEEEEQPTSTICKSCKNCSICCYLFLKEYNLIAETYPLIGLAYKYILTLSFTQVACERSFSTLKFVKNRLRSTLNQENLQAFMLMASERDILMSLKVKKKYEYN